MPEVKLISINVKHIRTDMPFVEYNEHRRDDSVADTLNPEPLSYVVHRAKVLHFRKHIPSMIPEHYGNSSPHYEDNYIALNKDAQWLVDIFIDKEARKYLESMDSMRTTINTLKAELKESKMTMYEKFKRLIDNNFNIAKLY